MVLCNVYTICITTSVQKVNLFLCFIFYNFNIILPFYIFNIRYVWGEAKYTKYNKRNNNSVNFRGTKLLLGPPLVAGLTLMHGMNILQSRASAEKFTGGANEKKIEK